MYYSLVERVPIQDIAQSEGKIFDIIKGFRYPQKVNHSNVYLNQFILILLTEISRLNSNPKEKEEYILYKYPSFATNNMAIK